MVKRIFLSIGVCGFVIVFLSLLIIYITDYTLEIKYIGNIQNGGEGLPVEIIKTKEKLENATLEKFNIDITKNNVIISRGSKIDKVIFKKNKKVFKSHFIMVYLHNRYRDGNIYVYTTPKKEMYFDERTNGNIIYNDCN